jgi:hypothetical protein
MRWARYVAYTEMRNDNNKMDLTVPESNTWPEELIKKKEVK